MPITNLLFWLVLLGAAWIGYQLLNSYNQAEADALREIAVCRGMDRHQRAAQYDIKVGSHIVYKPVVSQHRTSFMSVGDQLNSSYESTIEFRLPSALATDSDQIEMTAVADCQSCA